MTNPQLYEENNTVKTKYDTDYIKYVKYSQVRSCKLTELFWSWKL